MRSWFLVCAALAGFALTSGQTVVAHAADPKAKAAKKKGEDDSTGIGKTLQWEDKVMGEDDKSAELDKIRKAQAINKAAAEKAEKEKAANAAREAKEREAAAKAGPQTQKRGGEVALPTLPDEGPSGGKGKAQHTEISPKLETEAAKAPPPAMKPADDKFIDKLLKEEGGSKKKRASTVEDKALVDMLASEKPGKAATGKKGKKDGVDDLLTEAEKAAPMPETKVKHDTPEWAKPEIRERAYTPPPPPVATKKEQPNDGIIRVVQGAAGSSSSGAKPAVATTTTRTPPPPAGSGTRKQTAAINSKPGEWADPFSDPSPRKGGKQVAAKRPMLEEEEEDVRPVRRASASVPSKREASRASSSGDWDDPFSDRDRKSTGTRRAAPAESPTKPAKAAPARGGNGKWDDPFTSNDAPAGKSARTVVAAREPAPKRGSKPAAAHRAAAAPAEAAAPAQGRWGALKKRR
jgi:hypothetical protein